MDRTLLRLYEGLCLTRMHACNMPAPWIRCVLMHKVKSSQIILQEGLWSVQFNPLATSGGRFCVKRSGLVHWIQVSRIISCEGFFSNGVDWEHQYHQYITCCMISNISNLKNIYRRLCALHIFALTGFCNLSRTCRGDTIWIVYLCYLQTLGYLQHTQAYTMTKHMMVYTMWHLKMTDRRISPLVIICNCLCSYY